MKSPAATLPGAVDRALRERFSISSLRPGQAEVIQHVLQGRDTLAVLPTGSGKSLCYQLPALFVDGLTLVVSPLIALMQDQAEKLEDLALQPAVVNSAVGDVAADDALDSVARRAARILLTTPEQLQDPDVLASLQRRRVGLVVVDEAHCTSQWGHDFRPAYLGLPDAIQALGRPPVLALTATATDRLIHDIAEQLRLDAVCVVKAALYRPNLVYAVRHVAGDAERLAAVQALVGTRPDPPAGIGSAPDTDSGDARRQGIVYAATVREAERLHAGLCASGHDAALYHGRRTAAQRRDAQARFMSGECPVMVATNAFGMGIDKPDVRFVVHAQLPGSLDAYYQETGRAGRDGERADCTLLHDEKDRQVQQFFLANRYPSATTLRQVVSTLHAVARARPVDFDTLRQALPGIGARKLQVALKMLCEAGIARRGAEGAFAWEGSQTTGQAVDAIAAGYDERARNDRATLEAMLHYARSGQCRWAMLLRYYGEQAAVERCGTCDSCRAADAAAQAMKAMQVRPATPEHNAGTVHQAVHQAAPRFAEGDAVRARRHGVGIVAAVTRERVDVRFPDGSLRRFLPRYLRPEATATKAASASGEPVA